MGYLRFAKCAMCKIFTRGSKNQLALCETCLKSSIQPRNTSISDSLGIFRWWLLAQDFKQMFQKNFPPWYGILLPPLVEYLWMKITFRQNLLCLSCECVWTREASRLRLTAISRRFHKKLHWFFENFEVSEVRCCSTHLLSFTFK